ncbi:MAG: caspase family protein [Leptospirales bacterium]|nr:caspase family protein [Leptospirales bacterium]
MRKKESITQLISGACLALLIAVAPAALSAQTLHAVIAVDSADSSIGESVQKDLESMTALAREISANTGMRLNLKQISGRQLNEGSLMGAVRALRPAQNDMIFFYYSGHGFRRQTTQTNWPVLAIPNSGGIEYSRILSELSAKNARFTLALADACNSYIDRSVSPTMNFRAFSEPSANNYRQLFLQSRGRVFATSSKPGQYSYAYDDGGAFTLEFMKALRSELNGQQAPSWDRMMRQAGRPIGSGSSVMNPVVQVALNQSPGNVADNDTPPGPPGPPTPPRPNQTTEDEDEAVDIEDVTEYDDSDSDDDATEVGSEAYCNELRDFMGTLQRMESNMPANVNLSRDRTRREQLRRMADQLAQMGGDDRYGAIVERLSIAVKLNNWSGFRAAFRDLKSYMTGHQRQHCR